MAGPPPATTRARGPLRSVAWAAVAVAAALVCGLLLRRATTPREDAGPAPSSRLDSAAPAALADPAAVDDARTSAAQVDANEARPASEPREEGPTVDVVDTRGRPVAGVRVRVVEGAEPLEVVTGADGTAPLPLARFEGWISLRAEAEGYLPSCGRFRWTTHGMQLEIARAGRVWGLVRERGTGSPVAGAEVSVAAGDRGCPEDPAPGARSDAAGRFELEGTPWPRTVAFLARAPGYRNLDQAFTLDEEAPAAPLELLLEPGRELSLEVLDLESLRPLAGARVEGRHGFELTDAAGRVTTSALAGRGEELVRLTIRAEGHCRLDLKLGGTSAERAAPVRILLPELATLDFTVRDPEGRPVAGAYVSPDVDWDELRRLGESGLQLTTPEERLGLPKGWRLVERDPDHGGLTDSQGRYRCPGFVPWRERIDVFVWTKGFAAWHGGVGPLGGPGSSLGVDVVLAEEAPRPAGSLELRLALNGQPLGGRLRWRGPTRWGEVWLTEEVVLIEDVEPGRVSLAYEGGRREAGCALLAELPSVVEVREAERVRIERALELATSTISGRVTDWRGTPVAEQWVSVRAPGACLQGDASTDASGAWRVEVGSDVDAYDVVVQAGKQRMSREGVPPGSEHVDFVLPGAGRVLARVLCSDTGKPPARVGLLWKRPADASYQPLDPLRFGVLPNPGGWVEVEVPVGALDLIAVAEQPADTYRPSEVASLTARPDAEPVRLELELARGLELDLVLADGVSPWPSDVRVLLVEERWSGEIRLDATPTDRAWSWDFGRAIPGVNPWTARKVALAVGERARVRQLEPGPYVLEAFPPSIVLEPARVLVTGRETAPVELRWRAP